MTDSIPWRSLDELDELDELGDEAGEALPELAEAALVDRRMAMRLMGASLALAAAGCDRPPSRALRSAPRASIEPGHLDYATTLDRQGHGFGVVVRTVGGRPVKIEGNPLHPLSRGASDAAIQAELLSLYDPDRSRAPVFRGRPVRWSEARRALAQQLGEVRARRGAGLHVLLRPIASPTFERLVEKAKAALPEAVFYGHRAIEMSDVLPPIADASLIVSFGADFLGPGPFQVRLAQDWADARRRGLEKGALPRLIVAESVPTLTGARADERLALGPAAILLLAQAVLATLKGLDSKAERIALDGYESAAPNDRQLDARAVAIASALRAAGPRALVLAGDGQHGSLHRVADAIAGLLDAPAIRSGRRADPLDLLSLSALEDGLTHGQVDDLVVLGCNPAYDGGPDFASRLRHARRSVHLGSGLDETARACTWHLPRRHALERWGDFRAPDGSIGLAQPIVAPVPALSDIELLALLAGERPDGLALLRKTWAGAAVTNEAWLKALEDGVLPPQPFAPPERTPPAATVAFGEPGGTMLLLGPSAHLGDGEGANNAWLQELPDPITKLVWGNAATLSPATAARYGVKIGEVIAITVETGSQKRTVEAPTWILPGQADDTVALTYGYGRTHAGRIGNGVGVDAFRFGLTDAAGFPCMVRPTGRRERLISTQRHHNVADARAFRRVAPGERAEPPREPPATLHAERKPKGERAWAMTIDLDACIGCAACTIACQAENNIPAVGPDEVAAGREMHWLRVDRAFSGAPAEPAISFQPVPCMHCESAPCEPVCPVEATVHSSEGLNQMNYDRCIGTRSCASNCPYKVRRFNWFDYQAEPPAAPEEAQNPSVRIRERGVIEKCTYCVQRIEASRAPDAPPPVTACQQACPTRAIRFGDLSDEAGEVARDRQDPRHYQLLGGLNLSPRTTYLARVEPPGD